MILTSPSTRPEPCPVRRESRLLGAVALALMSACSGGAASGSGGAGAGGTTTGAGTGGANATGGASGLGGADATGGASGLGGADATGGARGTGGVNGAGGEGGPPPGFWDPSDIPAAKNVMMFKFLNRTNGQFTDGEVYWSFKSGSISETHSFAEQPTYDMPANSSGRMYFYVCAAGAPVSCTGDPTKSKFYDFIEHTIGATQYNGNTTRVDAFGLKIAMRLRCADGFEATVGEDYATFAESRDATFQRFVAEVPPEFQALAQAPNAPYRIVQPGAGAFKTGGAQATYYDGFVDELWAANGLTIAKPGPNGSGLASYPDVSAAIFRHVGNVAGAFTPDGKLMNKNLWKDASTFYAAAPANYYARFWHAHALGGKAYGFPYDDVGSYSTYISHANPQYLLVAVGW